jgi:hypothetical protein
MAGKEKISVIVFDPSDQSFITAYVKKIKDYYKLLSSAEKAVDCFDIVNIDENCDAYVDDEGLLTNSFWITTLNVEQYVSPLQLAGKLVFTGGPDEEGNTTSVTKTIEELRALMYSVFHIGEKAEQ